MQTDLRDSCAPLPASPLPRGFFASGAVELAPRLLGKLLRRGEVVLRITEVEAYCEKDTACHARSGRTARNESIWGPPGRAYVYLCYGIHNMLNVVCDRDGRAAAVLVRACEPVAGLASVRARRGSRRGPDLLDGPGKVGAALDLDRSWDGHALYERGGLELLDAPPPAAVVAGRRIGIDYAAPRDVARRWRFAVAGSPWVSYRGGLRRIGSSRAGE